MQETMQNASKEFYQLKKIGFMYGLWIGCLMGTTGGLSGYVLVHILVSKFT